MYWLRKSGLVNDEESKVNNNICHRGANRTYRYHLPQNEVSARGRGVIHFNGCVHKEIVTTANSGGIIRGSGIGCYRSIQRRS